MHKLKKEIYTVIWKENYLYEYDNIKLHTNMRFEDYINVAFFQKYLNVLYSRKYTLLLNKIE